MQLPLAFLLMAVNIATMSLFVLLLTRSLRHLAASLSLASAHIFIFCWFFLSHLINVLVWALGFMLLIEQSDFSMSALLAINSYTTLGIDISHISEEWMFLPGFCGMVGFAMFGFSSALCFEVLAYLRSLDGNNSQTNS